MRVLMAITASLPSPVYGGPSTVALNQAKELVKRGHEVTIITSDIVSLNPRQSSIEHEQIFDGVRVIYFHSHYLKPHFSFVFSFDFRNWIKKNVTTYDVVHVHFAREWIPLVAAYVAVQKSIPVYLQPHGMLNRRGGLRDILDRIIVGRLLHSAYGVFALEKNEEEQLRDIALSSKIIPLPNGMEIPEECPKWDPENLVTGPILFLARLHPRKRVLDFIETARILHEQDPRLKFKIVGPDGGDLEEAKKRVEAYRLSHVVNFAGAVDYGKVYAEFAQAGCYLFPAVDEPFGMSILEALAVGTPTIITTGAKIAEILNSKGAVVVSEPNPKSLAESVYSLINQPEKAQSLSKAGRKVVYDHFSLDKVIDRLELIYSGGLKSNE